MRMIAKFAIGAAAMGLPLAAYATSQQTDNDDADEAAEMANAPKPAVSEAQARRMALSAAKGQIAEAEYEKEGGGWRWSFDIRENGKIHEIGVDAMTGKIVEDSWEAADEDDED